MGACSGIRVLEFTTGVAGPLTGSILGVMGAEVIKVETRRHPDFTRFRPLLSTKPNSQPLINCIGNLSKLGITLDLTNKKGFDLAKSLIRISDVVVESFRPGVFAQLGLSYEVLKEIRQDIILLSSSASGQDGPEAHASGYASLFCAVSGLGDLTGYRDGPPTNLRVQYDELSGYTSAFAILAALFHRQKTGEGQFIDFSSREAIACSIGEAYMDYSMNNRVQSRCGNEDEIMAPHECYRCLGEDKWVSIAVQTDYEWRALCKACDRPEWAGDERFADALSRWHNRDELDKLIEGWTSQHTPSEAMDILQRHGVAAVPSFDAPDLFVDPHIQFRGRFFTMDHPEFGPRFELDYPWLTDNPERDIREAPQLGEHNEYVLGKLLGFTADEIAQMKNEEILY